MKLSFIKDTHKKENDHMLLQTKLSYNLSREVEGIREWYDELIGQQGVMKAKLSTKQLNIEYDREDNRYIKSLKKVEIAIMLTEGFLVLKGNLGCSYRPVFGGEFYLIDYKEITNGNFNMLGGIEFDLLFDNNNPISIDNMKLMLMQIAHRPDFVFNIGQFDEFMEVFRFYKKLSDEINNSATYPILHTSRPYNYLPVDSKALYDEKGSILSMYNGLETLYDSHDIIKGFKVPNYIYERFDNSLKDITLSLVDITIEYSDEIQRRIQRMSDNLFISDYLTVDEKNLKMLHEVDLLNMTKQKDELILSIIENTDVTEKYLNLYDMGQKIKIESIENSLRLINQGTTGASMRMIEYLIGDEPMPSESSIIIDKDKFISQEIKKSKTKESYIKSLNQSQKIAFLKSIDGSPVTLIKGPPGTGKTHVINAITQYITKELNEKVVISSQTHVAIDNVLDKLMENYDLIIPNRITRKRNKYSIEEIDKTLYRTWGSQISNHLTRTSYPNINTAIIEDIAKFKGLNEIQYSKNMKEDFSVIGATTTTTAIAGKKGLELFKDYNWLIIDEVSKSPITEVLRYLPYVEKIILVGDDYQLSPLLEFSKEDVKHLPSYDEDMFEKLETIYKQSVFSKTIKKAEKAGRLILLDENYRSLKPVLDAYNVFYNGALKNVRETFNPKVTQFNTNAILRNDKNTFFVEVLGGTEQDDYKSHSRFNMQEAQATAIVLKNILETLVAPHTITVSAIFPYAAQIALFTKNYKDLINRAKQVLKSFELDTVDAFQGRETDIVLVNTVVTRLDKKNFLIDFRRINVSMSRAKDKLVVFGSRNLERLEMETPEGGTRQYFRSIIEDIRKNGLYIQIDQKGEVVKNDRINSSKFA